MIKGLGRSVPSDGKTIASAGADKKIKFWDVASGSLRSTLFRPVNCTDVAFSPDGKYLAIAGGDHGENPPGELVLIEAAKVEDGFAPKATSYSKITKRLSTPRAWLSLQMASGLHRAETTNWSRFGMLSNGICTSNDRPHGIGQSSCLFA